LSFIGRLGLHMNRVAFSEKEQNYINEAVYEMSASGMVLVPEKQPFADRATGVPSLVAAKLCPNKLVFPRGDKWFQDTFKKYFELRNGVMHSKFGECPPRVSKVELREAFESARAYFGHISAAGGILKMYSSLLQGTPLRHLSPNG
jgi:hypothetical protein